MHVPPPFSSTASLSIFLTLKNEDLKWVSESHASTFPLKKWSLMHVQFLKWNLMAIKVNWPHQHWTYYSCDIILTWVLWSSFAHEIALTTEQTVPLENGHGSVYTGLTCGKALSTNIKWGSPIISKTTSEQRFPFVTLSCESISHYFSFLYDRHDSEQTLWSSLN